MTVKKTVKLDEKLVADVQKAADDTATSFTQILEDAMQLYLNHRMMGEKATLINEQVIKVVDDRMQLLERRVNQKTNKVLSELAIQQAIMVLLMAGNLDVPLDAVDQYRQHAVEFLASNNRVLRLDEVAGDA